MKIGILTVPFNNNYGGYLQAYALKTTLQKMGHEVIFIIRKRNEENILRNLLAYCLGRRKECLVLLKYRTFLLSKYTRRFVNKYLRPFTRNYYSTPKLKDCERLGIDLYIAGSDQCWRSKYAEGYIDDYFFKHLKGTNKKRISYAASFGTKEFEYSREMQKSCMELLKEFSSISVRETFGIDTLEKYFEIPNGFAKVVLDPTMLIGIEEYRSLFVNFPQLCYNYIFTYILDLTTVSNNIVKKIMDELCLPNEIIKAQTGDIRKIKCIEPVEKWLSRIYYSTYVCTDSFHGTVFSILFNRPFIVILNESRGSARIESLLEVFGLCDRIVSHESEITKEKIKKHIDWENVNKILRSQQNKSMEFLTNAIKNA